MLVIASRRLLRRGTGERTGVVSSSGCSTHSHKVMVRKGGRVSWATAPNTVVARRHEHVATRDFSDLCCISNEAKRQIVPSATPASEGQ
jgi:hypothetical protein